MSHFLIRLMHKVGELTHHSKSIALSQKSKERKDISRRGEIAPSGKIYPHVSSHDWIPYPRNWEVQMYIDQAGYAAHWLGIRDYEIWTQNSPRGPVVKLGAMDFEDYARWIIHLHGDSFGQNRHKYTITDDISGEYTNRWVMAANKLLEDNGIPYKSHRIDVNQVLYSFNCYSHLAAFGIVIERGIIDQLAHGQGINPEFPNLTGPKARIGRQPSINYFERHFRPGEA